MFKINPKKTNIIVSKNAPQKCGYVFYIGNEMIASYKTIILT